MKTKTGLIFLGVMLVMSRSSWAFCAAPDHSYITLAITNLTGYSLNVDTSAAAPNYHSSSSIPSFTVPATSPDNVVWEDGAISIVSCFEMGAPAYGTGTLKFVFPSADQGEAGGALGPVGLSLSYSASWDSNYSGMHPEIKSINITQNIFDTVPGVSPITGVATIYQDPNSPDHAYFNIVFYDLAPGVSGNQNVRRPFDPFFKPTSLPESS